MPALIDVLLVATGLACLAVGHWPAALALAGFGLVTPLAQRSGRKRFTDPAALVPTDLADAHRQVVAAAALPGVEDAARVVEASEDALLEVVAVLGGRPPRGAAQRRLVAAHVTVLAGTAADLRERSEAWLAARAELGAVDVLPLAPPPPEAHDPLAAALTVVLGPFFVLWDGTCLAGRGVVALVDGLALRVRTLAVLARAARGEWARARARVGGAAVEARHRFLAARARLRLRLRRARRARSV